MEKISENNNLFKPFIVRSLNRLPNWLINKYFLTGLAFLIWMLFFATNDIFTQRQRILRSKELTKNESYQSNLIKETQKELGFLKNSAQTIEKYARENYMMKKPNEDLFIINSSNTAK